MNEIKDFINNDFEPLMVQDTINEAQNIFFDFEYNHFPVIEHDVFIGSLAKEDAEILELNDKIADHKYNLKRFFVRENQNWFDVFEEFSKNNTNILPVLNEQNNYVGYYELKDVLEFFHETPFLKEEGSILIVEKNSVDYSFSQVCQIVESNNSKIYGVFVSQLNPTITQITLKISQQNFNEVLQSFRRYEYDIISDHQEDTYLESLKDRSDYLDKYLNL